LKAECAGLAFAEVLALVVPVWAEVSAELLSAELGEVDAAGEDSSGVGEGAAVVGTVVAGSFGTGCTCWARLAVDESARTAAIAGRALVRAYRVTLIIVE
jgi:hypothetical protein